MPDETEDLTPTLELDQVLADYVAAEEAGQPPDRQELLARHPQLAAELREFFANRDQMQRLAAPLRGPQTSVSQGGRALGKVRYFGDYELIEEIAAGGMGVVYKARQVSLSRIVAVKMILKGTLASEEDVKRFQAEAEAAANLQHPAIVAIHEVGLHEGQHYFSMDYVEGHSLAELPRQQPLSGRQAAEYVRDAAEAVHYAHQQGTLHRDLKPSNILIDSYGRVRITDFGLAKRIEGNSDLTLTGQILGTPSYMPPEQASGKRSLIGAASDIYSLGAVLYDLLTGRPPFRGESPAETLRQVESLDALSPRLLNPTTPRDLETICLKCLEKEPHKRYGTAQLLADDLGRYLRGEPIVARPIRAWQRTVKWLRRHPTAAGLAVMSFVALLAVMGLLVGQAYNFRLQTLNDQLASAKTNLETRNEQLSTANNALETAKVSLETSNEELGEASSKLETALADVKAERARARRYLYTARMALVQRAEQENKPARVVQLLRSLIPESPEQEDLRDFEWHHLWRKYCGEQLHLAAHTAPVTALAFGPERNLLASGSDDGVLKIWDAVAGKLIHTLPAHQHRITSISISADGQRLVTGSSDTTLKVWDLAGFNEVCTTAGHAKRITATAYSPSGEHFASGSDDGHIILWDARTGREVAKHNGDGPGIRGLTFASDGASLTIATTQTMGAWKPFSGEAPTWLPFAPTTSNVSFTADGTLSFSAKAVDAPLARRQTDNRIQLRSTLTIWYCEQNRQSHSFEIVGTVAATAFSPDKTTFAASIAENEYNTVRVWDAQGFNELYVHRDQSTIQSLAFAPGGERIAAGTDDGAIMLWTLPGRESRVIHQAETRVNSVGFGDNGRLLGIFAGNVARVWDLSRGRQINVWTNDLDRRSGYQRIALSPNKALVAGAIPETMVDARSSHSINLTGRDLKSDQPRPGGYRAFGSAFSQDGSLVAEASGNTWVAVWKADTGAIVRTIEFDREVASVAFSPDNKLLAAGSGYGAMEVFDLGSGRPVLPKRVVPFGVWGLAFSPDGKYLAAAMGLYSEKGVNTNVVKVWSTANWDLVYDLRGHSQCVWSVAFNSAGTRLISASSQWNAIRGGGFATKSPPNPSSALVATGEAKVWDLATGHEVLTIADTVGGIMSAAFSPDGRFLATAGQAGFVRLWDGTPVGELPNHETLAEEPFDSATVVAAPSARNAASPVSGPPISPNATRVLPGKASTAAQVIASRSLIAGQRYSRAGQWNEAIEEYSMAIANVPDYQLAWFERARAHFNLRHWGEAIADYRESLRLKPNDVVSHINIAISLRHKANLNASIAEYETAIRLNPKRAASHYGLGLSYAAKRSYNDAIVAYREAIRLKANYHEAHYALGIAQRRLGRFSEAIAAYQDSIRHMPNYAPPHNSLAWLLVTCSESQLLDPPRAVELASKATELTPTSATYWNTLGVAQYRAGAWQEAIVALEKSEQIMSGGQVFGSNALFLAMSHWQLSQHQQAHHWYGQAVQWIEENRAALEKDGRAKDLRHFTSEAAVLLGNQPPER